MPVSFVCFLTMRAEVDTLAQEVISSREYPDDTCPRSSEFPVELTGGIFLVSCVTSVEMEMSAHIQLRMLSLCSVYPIFFVFPLL